MIFTDEEKQELKKTFLYLIEKKHQESQGHCGFHLNELKPILEELVVEKKITIRPTINTVMYFKNK
jgi:hypothetical protein